MARFFHAMEKCFAVFPRYGKMFSIVWKTAAGLIAAFLILVFALVCLHAPAGRDATLAGETMGTAYSIRIAHAALNESELNDLHKEIRQWLANINWEFSAYLPDSKLSRFNRAGAGEPVDISPDFQRVVRRALEIAAATGGAFDPTVGALVNLWGFGPDGRRREPPSPDSLAAAREKTGWRHLALTADGFLVKDIPALQLDLGAIAKGFGVDKIAELLRDRGVANFLVEIGGETRAKGYNVHGQPWRVGVLRPDYAPAAPVLQGVARLAGGRAIATSGDYRNFFRGENGAVETHIIDPRTAAPARHATASVSVLANDCLTADALATALFVLGPDEGLPLLATRFPGSEALFLLRAADGRFTEAPSPGWAAKTRYRPAGAD